MAKFKKTANKSTASAKTDVQAQAERLSKTLSESAQQIWLAGVGAFGRAQAEGTKLFEGLVKEGLNLEQTARKFAGGRTDVVRDVVENRVDQARERATDTWDRLEKVFEDRVQRALTKLGVPGPRRPRRPQRARRDADRRTAPPGHAPRRKADRKHAARRPQAGQGRARREESREAGRQGAPRDRQAQAPAPKAAEQPAVAAIAATADALPANQREVRMLPSPYGFGLAGFLFAPIHRVR